MIEKTHYERLLRQESDHWGNVRQDPHNPQLWHDSELFEIFFGKEYNHFLERILRCGPRVLELGCGEGDLTIRLAQRGKNVTAIDLSAERIKRAEAKALAAAPVNVPEFRIDDLNTIILPQASFDCVVTHDALHHVLALDRLLTEVQKALRPGGHFIVMDFIGMGFLRKLIAAGLFALLPTHQPYAAKWKLRKRLPAFFAGEERKRRALESGSGSALHEESPFEEISQYSIVPQIERRFTVDECFTFNPFWYYLAPKVTLPARWRSPVVKMMHSMDDRLCKLGLAQGAYFFLEATR